MFFYSPRKYGKTSLITKVLGLLQAEGLFTIYLDLYQVPSKKVWLELYAKAISKGVAGRIEGIKRFIKEYLPGFIPKIIIKGEDSPDIEFEYVSSRKGIERYLMDVYDLPQKVAEKKGRKGVVVMDEFQEIRNLDGEEMEKQIRSIIQHHDKISYVFVGSKKGMLLDIFTNRKKPLYNIGKMLTLKKIPAENMAEFIRNRFNHTQHSITEEVIEEILSLTENHPYFTQMLCHEIWDLLFPGQDVQSKDIKEAINQILSNQSELYFIIWDSLSPHQKNLLFALTKTRSSRIYSADFINNHSLGSTSMIQKSIRALLNKEVIEKNEGIYEIQDVFFRQWLQTRMLP
ncbi:MAG: ATP-binding protein [bacterium]